MQLHKSKLNYRSWKNLQTSFPKEAIVNNNNNPPSTLSSPNSIPLSPTHPYCTLFTSSTSIFDAPVPVSPRNKSGRSSQLARPTVPATVSKSAETPYIHIIEEEKHFLWARFKGHTLLYTFTPYTNVWEIYKVTDRRRAHVQFPWNIHENKPLSRRRETSSRVSCGLAQGRRRP